MKSSVLTAYNQTWRVLLEEKSSLDRKLNSLSPYQQDTCAELTELVCSAPCSLNWGAELPHHRGKR